MLLLALILAACSTDTLIKEVQLPIEAVMVPRPISFDMHAGNTTRAITPMNRTNHYEFGIFASYDAPYDSAGSALVMQNYLVGYGLQPTYKPWYEQFVKADDQNPVSSNSAWIYTSLGHNDPLGPMAKQPLTKSTQPQQVAKFWDLGTERYYFHAYTPYMPVGVANMPGSITLGNDSQGEYLHFNGLRAFYTDPVEQIGIETGCHTASGYDSNEALTGNNAEIINANEALYAANMVDPHSYVNDVSLIFKHVNAKVRIAFWENIPGYSVTMLDLVPEDVHITYGGGVPSYPGVAFTPTRREMTEWPQPSVNYEPSTYYRQAQVRLKGIAPISEDSRTNFAGIEVGNPQVDMPVSENLRFLTPTDTLGEKREKAAFSPTIYYPLPNYESTLPQPGYITDLRDTLQVASRTGYTLLPSYCLHPEDGAADIRVYDARVFIPAEKCQWEAGKQYTYLFRITIGSNGTTDPDKPDPTDPDNPWVDPDDPRIPDTPALLPIVFDGISVDDYDEITIVPDFTL